MDGGVVYGEDGLCSYPSLLDANCIYVLHRPLYHYRQNFSSVTNTYDPQKMGNFLRMADELERQFKQRGVDMERQLKGYIAICSLEHIRNELLLNKTVSCKERRYAVREYISESMVGKAFVAVIKELAVGKVAFKVRLVCNGHIFLLHLLLRLKQMVRFRREKNG